MSKINIPAGFVLVPREPTQEMMDAFEAAPEDQPRSWVRAYSDMIDVAPAPPVDAVLGEPVGEIVGTEKRGFALTTIVRWEPGFNRMKIGTLLYDRAAPLARVPLTDDAISSHYVGSDIQPQLYDKCGMFEAGVRWAESMHGIAAPTTPGAGVGS